MRLTCAEAEALTKIPASTWRRWISEGRLTASPVNGRVTITRSDATRLAEKRHKRSRLP